MRLVTTLLLLLLADRALAQANAGAGAATVRPAEPVIDGERPGQDLPAAEIRLREPGSDFRWHAPAAVGTCLGGSCAQLSVPAGPRLGAPSSEPPPLARRMRFAYAGALLGTVSAGIALGSAVAIAVANDRESERITRGLWLGYLTASVGVVALSSQLARNALGGAASATRATRSLGWTAFVLAAADGAILWAGAFRGFGHTDALTIGAGAIAACALLPHALDAYQAGRGLRAGGMVRLEPGLPGLRVRF